MRESTITMEKDQSRYLVLCFQNRNILGCEKDCDNDDQTADFYANITKM